MLMTHCIVNDMCSIVKICCSSFQQRRRANPYRGNILYQLNWSLCNLLPVRLQHAPCQPIHRLKNRQQHNTERISQEHPCLHDIIPQLIILLLIYRLEVICFVNLTPGRPRRLRRFHPPSLPTLLPLYKAKTLYKSDGLCAHSPTRLPTLCF
jgi:hypothetical protein